MSSPSGAAVVEHIQAGQRYEILVDGARAGLTAYRDRGGQRVFFHTEIDNVDDDVQHRIRNRPPAGTAGHEANLAVFDHGHGDPRDFEVVASALDYWIEIALGGSHRGSRQYRRHKLISPSRVDHRLLSSKARGGGPPA